MGVSVSAKEPARPGPVGAEEMGEGGGLVLERARARGVLVKGRVKRKRRARGRVVRNMVVAEGGGGGGWGLILGGRKGGRRHVAAAARVTPKFTEFWGDRMFENLHCGFKVLRGFLCARGDECFLVVW